MDASLLSGRQAFITGSTSGVGAGMAAALESAGATVLRHGLSEDEVPAGTSMLAADLAEGLPDSARQLAADVLAAQPANSLLVCNAGIFIDLPFLETDFERFQRTMQLNVASSFVLVQEFARHWVQNSIRGRIVLTGSINGRLAEPDHVAYDTSKGAVEAMVRSLSVALAPKGIRVNGVAPGLFLTPLTEPALKNPAFRYWMELHTPNGQVPGPEAAAGATVFLMSDHAEHIHGQMLFVDGGMSIWQQPDMPDGWPARA